MSFAASSPSRWPSAPLPRFRANVVGHGALSTCLPCRSSRSRASSGRGQAFVGSYPPATGPSAPPARGGARPGGQARSRAFSRTGPRVRVGKGCGGQRRGLGRDATKIEGSFSEKRGRGSATLPRERLRTICLTGVPLPRRRHRAASSPIGSASPDISPARLPRSPGVRPASRSSPGRRGTSRRSGAVWRRASRSCARRASTRAGCWRGSSSSGRCAWPRWAFFCTPSTCRRRCEIRC